VTVTDDGGFDDRDWNMFGVICIIGGLVLMTYEFLRVMW